MATSPVVGLDIGGANLKYASSCQRSFSRTFPMWRCHDELADAVHKDLASAMPASDCWAVTMTGELADCFQDRQQGVHHIVDHICRAANKLGVNDVSFYGVDGAFRSASQAKLAVDQVAAANWHALASFVARDIASDGLLVDVGSTTCDLIPIASGRVATDAQTDTDRLGEGSLVYVGCRRTPVCSIVDNLQWGNRDIAVMNELFATIDDARIVLGHQPQQLQDCDSADGKPRSRIGAGTRLLRMIGLDWRTADDDVATSLARQIHTAVQERIRHAISQAPIRNPLLVTGHGEDLIVPADDTTVISVFDQLDKHLSRCAPSYAVACLRQQVCA